MNAIDKFLKENLSADFVPDTMLNMSILRQAKENEKMKQKTLKPGVTAAAIAGILLLGSASAYAAYQYLTPAQVADHLKLREGDLLSEAFESSTAVIVNETQTSAGYEVTFLGTVTGENLIGSIQDTQTAETLHALRTYAVVAIRHLDGSPMPSVTDSDYETFCVSALINGKTFLEANNGTLNAGASAFVQDGIHYQLLECDNLEIFSDMGVSIGVVESFGNETSAFHYDETTGIYRINTDYEGINALFKLPLDPSKADPQAAKEYFENKNTESSDTNEEITTGSPEADQWLENFRIAGNSSEDTWSFVEENAIMTSQQTLTPDTNGFITYHSPDGESEGLYQVGDWPYAPDIELFSSGQSDGTLSGTQATTLTLNADGTFTLRIYEPRQSSKGY